MILDKITNNNFIAEFTGGSLPDTLQKVVMTVLSNTDCSDIWKGDINDGHICIGNAKDITNEKSACHVSTIYLITKKIFVWYLD
jgi:hypothetical protein